MLISLGFKQAVTKSTCRPWRGAFTLIELLVVVAIIALLVAILLPALQEAKEMAGQAVCMTNLKSLGLVVAMYTNDSNGFFPGGDSTKGLGYPTWVSALNAGDYVASASKLYGCPTHEEYKPDLMHISYGRNLFCGSSWLSEIWGHSTWVRSSEVLNPSKKICIADNNNSSTAPDGGFDLEPFESWDDWPWRLGRRHNGGANILWCDGHVSYVDAERHTIITEGWINLAIYEYWVLWFE